MMRPAPLFLALVVGCVPQVAPMRPASFTEDLNAARALDEQGVRAFEAGRIRDALLYFDAALAHGGPASELWNAARCHLRLDEPAQAEATLVEYVSHTDLSKYDLREAETTLETIRKKPSFLTVLSAPIGLPVSVDGRRVGVTPITTSVAPGDHVLVVERPEGHQSRPFAARYGRAILIEAHP